MVYPLPSRIDGQYDVLRKLWRSGDKTANIEGYEQQFSRILKESYALSDCNLTNYFEEIQIQHSPEYSYGEPVVALDQERSDRFSLLRSYQSLMDWLCSFAAPWEDRQKARDRKQLELLLTQVQVGKNDSSGLRHVDISQNIFELSRKLYGLRSLNTINAMQQLIEALLIDFGDRPRADDAIKLLIDELKSLPRSLRWSSVAFLLRSGATLRKLNDEARASRLRHDIKQLLDHDDDFNNSTGLGTFITVADEFYGRGDLVEARFVLELILEKVSNVGAYIELKIAALNRLGEIFQAAGDNTGAVALYRQVLELARDEHGAEDGVIATALRSLIKILLSQGRIVECQKYQEELVEFDRRKFGDQAPATLEALGSLAATLQTLGTMTGDATLLERALEYTAKAKGNYHGDTIAAGRGGLLRCPRSA